MSDRRDAAVRQVKANMSAGSALAAQLAKDDAFAEAVGDLVEADQNSPEYSKIAADPKQYFERRKVALPPNARVAMTRSDLGVTVEVCINGVCITVSVQL